MVPIKLEILLGHVHALLTRSCQLDIARNHIPNFDASNEIQAIRLSLEHLADACDVIDLGMTRIEIQRMLSKLEGATTFVHGDVGSWASQVVNRLRDETSQRSFIYLPGKSMELVTKRQLFGEMVSQRFPEASCDIDESAKCLAFWRGTASAFHSMRVIEVGIKTLIATFGEEPQTVLDTRNWGRLISRISKEASKDDKKVTPLWLNHRGRLKVLAMHLDHLKGAWRNPTMHVERQYTVEEARDVFDGTRLFMRALAEELKSVETQHEEETDSKNPVG